MTVSPLVSAALLVPHGFFTRQGGVSSGPFASLNCSLSGADGRDAVTENRARAARAIGADPEHLLGLTQVHGAKVETIAAGDPAWRLGDGPRADAMVTNRAGLTLGIVTADCAPVLFFDVSTGIVGAAHAGWRGALGGVAESTIAAMEQLGASPANISAVVGPCIAQASYEVDSVFRDRFLADDAANARFFVAGPAGKPHFDLPGYVLARLERAGIGGAQAVGLDTYADPGAFYSYRRSTHLEQADYGRQLSAIALP